MPCQHGPFNVVLMPKKTISELQSAELKYRALLNKRDEINAQAALLRDERDTLHEQKRALQAEVRAARDRRDALVAEMKAHKQRRDELQAKAKELIEFKKKMKGQPTGSLKDEIRSLERQIKEMELRQQTVPLSIPKERELLEDMKRKMAEVEKLKGVLAEQERIQKEIKDIDRSIDALFKEADKEHAEVVRLSEEQHKAHEEAVAHTKEIAALTAAANKKHEEYLRLKAEADAAHQKAQEMREKIIEIKGEKRRERMEERRALRELNLAAKKALDDKQVRDKAAEEALQMLMKKGKVEIG
ncbi:MAG: hypothetical protein QXZ19_01865 [Thermoplasmata archaeon]